MPRGFGILYPRFQARLVFVNFLIKLDDFVCCADAHFGLSAISPNSAVEMAVRGSNEAIIDCWANTVEDCER